MTDPNADSLSRRNFLRGSLAGLAAASSAGFALTQGQMPIEQDGDGGGDGGGRGLGGTDRGVPDPLPDPSDPLNPATLPNVAETWGEPWVWRPSEWPGQNLVLNVVESAAPISGVASSFINVPPLLFSYNGTTPGPTIRMKGDETLFVELRNLLGRDFGQTPVGISPDPAALSMGPEGAAIQAEKSAGLNFYGEGDGLIPATLKDNFCLGEHVNGTHSTHHTNIHTHGLHVSPGRNEDNTHSDNIYLRVMPQADWRARQVTPDCDFLLPDEIVGLALYEFRLGDVQGDPSQKHPAGTFWYHPHSHGATHNQVASGMAGFLVVEGEEDEAINRQLTGDPFADPVIRTGPFAYRERLMLIQRVNNGVKAADPDAQPGLLPQITTTSVIPSVNGSFEPRTIVLQPGAIERWRVLNGSVDGGAPINFMVLKGEWSWETNPTTGNAGLAQITFVPTEQATAAPVPGSGQGGGRGQGGGNGQGGGRGSGQGGGRGQNAVAAGAITYQRMAQFVGNPCVPDAIQREQLDSYKQPLWMLSWDGVTLVQANNGGYAYFIANLAENALGNPWQANPLYADLSNRFDAYTDTNSVMNAYYRPNEIDMAAADRADVFFQAPPLVDPNLPEVYTVIARSNPLHGDGGLAPDTIVAYVIVRGQPVQGLTAAPYPFDFSTITLPAVQDYLLPIEDPELQIGADEAAQSGAQAGEFRTRVISYAGWGAAGFPAIEVPADYVEQNPDLDKLRYYQAPSSLTLDGVNWTDLTQPDGSPLPTYLLPPNARTLNIDGRKFDPNDPDAPKILFNTAEEWAVTNNSVTLYGFPNSGVEYIAKKDGVDQPAQVYWGGHVTSYAVTRAQALEYNGNPIQNCPPGPGTPTPTPPATPQLAVVTNAADHPFHIHQNPFWLSRIDVPDQAGNLVNVLPFPRWADTLGVPRNGGRGVFRMRFPDFDGRWVNHCHILLHEDNGMMQPVNVITDASQVNYVPRAEVTAPNMTPEEVNAIYPTNAQDPGAAFTASLTYTEVFGASHSIDQTNPHNDHGNDADEDVIVSPYPGFPVKPLTYPDLPPADEVRLHHHTAAPTPVIATGTGHDEFGH
ncbi:MAG: multicopper oxidase domain-containing protein [Anaerolineae bacterium]|nr:multicopper oxidase domain-containing protein [Anaerolineae bacterium]